MILLVFKTNFPDIIISGNLFMVFRLFSTFSRRLSSHIYGAKKISFLFGAIAGSFFIHITPVVQCSSKKRADHFDPSPRETYLSWDDYFMSIAFLSGQRSKDPNKQVGACIVGANRIIRGIGYNGFPRGCCDHDLPWAKKSHEGKLHTKYLYVCHAEMNAILNTNDASLEGATIYVTMFPCCECAKMIIQSGIKEVVYFEAKHPEPPHLDGSGDFEWQDAGAVDTYVASLRMLNMAKIVVRQHRPKVNICTEEFCLDFFTDF